MFGDVLIEGIDIFCEFESGAEVVVIVSVDGGHEGVSAEDEGSFGEELSE